MGKTADALGQIDLFADLTKKERVEIERIMTPIYIKAGREFIKEGTVGREAFIILEGDATVWRHGRLVTHVGPGAFLGEMAVLAGTPARPRCAPRPTWRSRCCRAPSSAPSSTTCPRSPRSCSSPRSSGSTSSSPPCSADVAPPRPPGRVATD